MNDRTGDRYAFLQFIKAKESGQAEKARSWSDVLSGILTGELKIGSRKPVQGMPAWATPQVLRGGFATGAYAAGGALLPHELTLAEELKIASTDTRRSGPHSTDGSCRMTVFRAFPSGSKCGAMRPIRRRKWRWFA